MKSCKKWLVRGIWGVEDSVIYYHVDRHSSRLLPHCTGNPRDETVSPDLVTGNSSVGPPRVCWRWPVEGGTSRVTKVTLELSGLPWWHWITQGYQVDTRLTRVAGHIQCRHSRVSAVPDYQQCLPSCLCSGYLLLLLTPFAHLRDGHGDLQGL